METFTVDERLLLDEIDSHELDCKCDLCMEFVNANGYSKWKTTVAARLKETHAADTGKRERE